MRASFYYGRAAGGQLKVNCGQSARAGWIPNEVLRVVVNARPEMFTNIFNQCLSDGNFPKQWKRARLVLLKKGDKPADRPSSYRPERIVCNKIEEYFNDSQNDLADNQYGFRKGRSTIDAINKVLEISRETGSRAYHKRFLCVLVTLDAANAFNLISWMAIDRALVRMRVPGYLVRIIRSYLKDRIVIYEEEETMVRLSCGVPQGSVLGPLL